MVKQDVIPFYEKQPPVYRSSAIFYYRSGNGFKTTISFFNYWMAKRGISVTVSATLRDLAGKEVERKSLDFSVGEALNYSPLDGSAFFEGSAEIEVFSETDLVIPYAAIMACYESPNSISLTHSYARRYSQSEIASGNTITQGEEGCWTIRDHHRIRSFCVIHNGKQAVPCQVITMRVRNHAGEERVEEIADVQLAPHQTIKLYPSEHFSGLAEFLNGQPGSGTVSFKLNDAFTRMLLCSESIEDQELQTAHSNFNYELKHPGFTQSKGPATMLFPDFKTGDEQVILYPDYTSESYEVSVDGDFLLALDNSRRQQHRVGCKTGSKLSITTPSGKVPKRFVTGFESKAPTKVIPTEVSRGVRHSDEPPKRFWWGPVIKSDEFETKIVLNPYTDYSSLAPNIKGTFRLYSQGTKEIISKSYEELPSENLAAGMKINSIFGFDVAEFLDHTTGYFTFYSEFACFDCLVIFERHDGCIAMEHCF